MNGWRILLTFLGFPLTIFLSPIYSGAQPSEFPGVVVEVNPKKQEIVISNPTNAVTALFVFSQKTQITEAEARRSLADLRPGTLVNIHYLEEEGQYRASKIDIQKKE